MPQAAAPDSSSSSTVTTPSTVTTASTSSSTSSTPTSLTAFISGVTADLRMSSPQDAQPGTLKAPERVAPVWRDLSAGLCVAGLLLPEAVAYAGLAHLPVIHALTASLVGLALYGAFGGSRFAVVAPTSSTATLAAAAAVSLGAGPAGPPNGTWVAALVLLAGGLLMLLALARQGQLSSFISRPVLRGFAFALAITIVIKQLPDALGLLLPPALPHDPARVLFNVLSRVSDWHAASAAVALVAAALLMLLRRWPQVPGAMVVMVCAITASHLLNLPSWGVQEIGALQGFVLQLGFPQLDMRDWLRAAELAFGLVMLVFAESWGSMRTMALLHGERLNADRELMVLGACNTASALLQGMPVGAGFSATSANAAAGAVSKKAGLFAFAAMALAVAFALPLLHALPRPVLAVVVIGALWHALSPKPLITTWRMNRDRLLIVAAALGVLLFGVLHGMLAAVGLSLLAALQRFSQPVLHELGALAESRNYVDINAQVGARRVAGLLILRPEEPLFFGSAERVGAAVLARVAARVATGPTPGTEPVSESAFSEVKVAADHMDIAPIATISIANEPTAVTTVILSLEESADIDSTAFECLAELNQGLSRYGCVLHLARVKTTVRELLTRCDPQGLGLPERLHWSVADAVAACQVRQAKP